MLDYGLVWHGTARVNTNGIGQTTRVKGNVVKESSSVAHINEEDLLASEATAPADPSEVDSQPSVDGFERLSPEVCQWFTEEIGQPTPIQLQAWDAISRGQNVLAIAPTGSGKTFAAFLFAIDQLLKQKLEETELATPPQPGVRVLYISPLKALGADVEKNLAFPLAALEERIAPAQGERPSIRTAVRSGDTSADERRKILRNPPDILITTPESLYLLLTSQGEEILRTVETVIVDEIHSLAGDKRGAHLSLSLERLDALLEQPAQRIGLSATVRPVDVVAHFLGGQHPVTTVVDETAASIALSVRVPVSDLTAIPRFGGYGPHGKSLGDPLKPKASAARQQPWKSDRALKRFMAEDHDRVVSPDTRQGSASIWPYLEEAILEQVMAHTTTVVFVNSRGLCEKLTAHLNELYEKKYLGGTAGRPRDVSGVTAGVGDDIRDGAPDGSAISREGAACAQSKLGPSMSSLLGSTVSLVQETSTTIAKAHHGSVSKEKRLRVEQELKSGTLRCVVATSSLELGIDMGSIDLVIQVAPPPSVSSGLQRIGRANHQVNGVSQGILYPRTRTEIIDAAVISEGIQIRSIEQTALVKNALDVLAQQTVAHCSMHQDGLSAQEWFDLVRQSACYEDLPWSAMESVLSLLAGRFSSGDIAEFAPRIVWDESTGVLKPLPRSKRLAVSSVGTIPDRGMYRVVLPEGDAQHGRRQVGELDEEMVYESRVGDVITLGTNTWRIREIDRDRVIVEPAPGALARLPFWHGEMPARPYEAGRRRGQFLRRAAFALQSEEATTEWMESLELLGLDRNSATNLATLLHSQLSVTGVLPTDTTLVVEQCEDEMGDWRLLLHSPFGRTIHEPWALAIGQRLERQMGIQGAIAAADDGIVVRLPGTVEKMPGAELFRFDPEELQAIVRQSVGTTALFAARFRECAQRALLMTPQTPGQRTPLWQQRLKAGQLLEVARREPSFPLLAETARECLQSVFNLEGLTEVMRALDGGEIALKEARTTIPSPFAAPLLFGYVGEHLYEGDLPHAETKTALLSVDPLLLGELLGDVPWDEVLDAEEGRLLEEQLQSLGSYQKPASMEAAALLLRNLGPMDTQALCARMTMTSPESGPEPTSDQLLPEQVNSWLASLAQDHRIFSFERGGALLWADADDGLRLHRLLGVSLPSWLSERAAGANVDSAMLLQGLIGRYGRTHSSFTVDEVAEHCGFGPALVSEFLQNAQGEGTFVALDGHDRWAEASILRRWRQRSLKKARQEAQAVSTSTYLRFLEALQLVAPQDPRRNEAKGSAVRGRLISAEEERALDEVAAVLALFEGVALDPKLLEEVILPVRVSDYKPSYLDQLMETGELCWWGQEDKEGEFRVALYPTDSPFAPQELTGAPEEELTTEQDPAREPDLPTAIQRLLRLLRSQGPLSYDALEEHWLRQQEVQGSAAEEDRLPTLFEHLARTGALISDRLGFVRAHGRVGAARTAAGRGRTREELPTRRRVSSRRTRSMYREAKAAARSAVAERLQANRAQDEALAGQWAVVATPLVSSTLRALNLVESLLDRYGVITPAIARTAEVPGGFEMLLPVLRSMEERGEVVSGSFVEGLGPLQFARREAVERLRDFEAHETYHQGIVVLPCEDPLFLYGAALPWPPLAEPREFSASNDDGDQLPSLDGEQERGTAAKPRRCQGAYGVLIDGQLALWAAPHLSSLICFSADKERVTQALHGLVSALQQMAQRRGAQALREKLLVKYWNGQDVLAAPVVDLLKSVGFVLSTNGMRLYLSTF